MTAGDVGRVLIGLIGTVCIGLFIWFGGSPQARWQGLILLCIAVTTGVIVGYISKSINRIWPIYTLMLALVAIYWALPSPWSNFSLTSILEVTCGNLIGTEIAVRRMNRHRESEEWDLNGEILPTSNLALSSAKMMILTPFSPNRTAVRLSQGVRMIQARGDSTTGFLVHATGISSEPSLVSMLRRDQDSDNGEIRVTWGHDEFYIPANTLVPGEIVARLFGEYLEDHHLSPMAGWSWRGDDLAEELYFE